MSEDLNNLRLGSQAEPMSQFCPGGSWAGPHRVPPKPANITYNPAFWIWGKNRMIWLPWAIVPQMATEIHPHPHPAPASQPALSGLPATDILLIPGSHPSSMLPPWLLAAQFTTLIRTCRREPRGGRQYEGQQRWVHYCILSGWWVVEPPSIFHPSYGPLPQCPI